MFGEIPFRFLSNRLIQPKQFYYRFSIIINVQIVGRVNSIMRARLSSVCEEVTGWLPKHQRSVNVHNIPYVSTKIRRLNVFDTFVNDNW